ncbi:uncharacterized protein MONBRDRAFT_2753, partial [Monosiga brevicollis MX1]
CAEECSGNGECNPDGKCECAPCFHGVLCDESCSGHGVCTAEVCECDDDWGGDLCQSPICPGEDGACNGHGACNSYLHECVCGVGWSGDDCSPAICFDGPSCTRECSNHGTCVNGGCECDTAWWGERCGIRGCPGVGESCSGHGTCNPEEQVCRCDPGWRGVDCNTPDCPGEPDCNARGDCDPDEAYSRPICGTCGCAAGWTGTFCTEFDCANNCSAHGTCVWDNGDDLPHCECEPGFAGDNC